MYCPACGKWMSLPAPVLELLMYYVSAVNEVSSEVMCCCKAYAAVASMWYEMGYDMMGYLRN